MSGPDLAQLDLHRPSVDDITLACTDGTCAGTMRRVAPVLDAWFDSGAMPTAQQHFPFAGTEELGGSFPADFICEAIDQTRGWFYSLLAINSLVFDATPYRNVVCLALIVDEHGQKMSKSKGNVIAPFDIFDTLGADALRWYFFSAGQPWTPRRVFPEGIRESTRQTLLTLWNVWSFFATYADLDGWSPDAGVGTRPSTHVLDRWILSELDDTVEVVTDSLERLRCVRRCHEAGDVRRRSVELVRAALTATVLEGERSERPRHPARVPRHPVPAHGTVHPVPGRRALHGPHRRGVGAPLRLADVEGPPRRRPGEPDDVGRVGSWPWAAPPAPTPSRRSASRSRRALLLHPGAELDPEIDGEIRSELNVKALERIDTLSGLMSWSVLPNFRLLGPRLGPKVNAVKAALAEADGSALQSELERNGWVEVAGERLTADEVEVRADRHEALALVEDDGWAVALDLELDDDLRAEGMARELVRALNDVRKQVGLAIADRIVVTLATDAELGAVVKTHQVEIATEVLAVDIVVVDVLDDDDVTRLEVGGHPVGVRLTATTGPRRRLSVSEGRGRDRRRTRPRRRPSWPRRHRRRAGRAATPRRRGGCRGPGWPRPPRHRRRARVRPAPPVEGTSVALVVRHDRLGSVAVVTVAVVAAGVVVVRSLRRRRCRPGRRHRPRRRRPPLRRRRRRPRPRRPKRHQPTWRR